MPFSYNINNQECLNECRASPSEDEKFLKTKSLTIHLTNPDLNLGHSAMTESHSGGAMPTLGTCRLKLKYKGANPKLLDQSSSITIFASHVRSRGGAIMEFSNYAQVAQGNGRNLRCIYMKCTKN
ncbi:hypothetical protein Tco_0569536 [Tanacetum coccineum]